MDNLARIEEVAKLLNVSIPTLRLYIRQKSIPFVRVNGNIRFDVNQVQEWVRNQSITPDAKTGNEEGGK